MQAQRDPDAAPAASDRFAGASTVGMSMQPRGGPGRGSASAAGNRRFAMLTAGVAWLMLYLMLVPGAGMEFIDPESAAENAAGNPATRVIWLAFFAISVSIAASRTGLSLRLWRGTNVFLHLFAGLAIASIAWSIDPTVTITRVVRMLCIYAVCMAVAAAAWNPRRFQQLVRPVVTWLLLASIVFTLTFPDLGIHQESSPELLDAWKGLTGQKNILGSLAAFGFVLWLHALLSREAKPLGAAVGGGASAACLVLSRSSTSLMAAVFASLFLVLLMRTPGSMRRLMPYLSGGLTLAILLYALAMLRVVPGLEVLLSPIPMITGKDLTFSGRAQIWAAVVDHFQYRPMLGSGYGAYWTGPTPGTESYNIKQILFGFYPYSAHNGYLDILNDLGVAGLLCLAGYLIVYVRQSLRVYQFDRRQGALYLALFLWQAITNLSESMWLNVTTFDFAVMTLATTCIARALIEAQARPHASVKAWRPVHGAGHAARPMNPPGGQAP